MGMMFFLGSKSKSLESQLFGLLGTVNNSGDSVCSYMPPSFEDGNAGLVMSRAGKLLSRAAETVELRRRAVELLQRARSLIQEAGEVKRWVWGFTTYVWFG